MSRSYHGAISELQAQESLRAIAASLVSGALMAAAYPPSPLGAVGFVALVPWLIWLRRASVVRAVFLGALVGLVFGAWIARWIPHSGVLLGSSWTQGIGMMLVCTVLFSVVPFAVLGGILAKLRRLEGSAAVLTAGLAFFFVDAARSAGYLLVPWGLLGHSQITVPGVAQLAVIGGVPLVSAVVAMANQALVPLMDRGRSTRLSLAERGVAAAMLGAVLALALGGVATARALRPEPLGHSLRTLVVQANLPTGDRRAEGSQLTNLAILKRLTKRALEQHGGADLVFWPENMVTTPIDTNEELRVALEAVAFDTGVPVVAGVARSADGVDRYRSSVVWVDPAKGITSASDKTRAIPWVESSAPVPAWLSSVLGAAVVEGRRVAEAERPVPLRGDMELVVAPCYEVSFPSSLDPQRTNDSFAILNPSNDAWIESETLSRLQIAFAAFRAIEQRLTLVRADNGGLSGAISPYGEKRETLGFDERGSLLIEVSGSAPSTRVEKAGLILLALFGGSVGTLALRRFVP